MAVASRRRRAGGETVGRLQRRDHETNSVSSLSLAEMRKNWIERNGAHESQDMGDLHSAAGGISADHLVQASDT